MKILYKIFKIIVIAYVIYLLYEFFSPTVKRINSLRNDYKAQLNELKEREKQLKLQLNENRRLKNTQTNCMA